MKKYFILVGMFLPFNLLCQVITGKVTNQNNEPLVGASVFWENSGTGVSTDKNGTFTIPVSSKNKRLISSMVGYTPDTLVFSGILTLNFVLYENATLNEVIISRRKEGVVLSTLNPIKTERITQTELRKAACCDLAGCFETQTTVQPQTTNIITNSKELRILGLSGVYNQVLIDGFPLIKGLSYTYGISSIPGKLVDDIHVSKGANSVLQGFESIAGQINVETTELSNSPKLLVNAYLNSFMEKHLYAGISNKKGKWSNITSFQVISPGNKIDRDNDLFIDNPLLTRYLVFSKWHYGNAREWGWYNISGFRFYKEKRIGGQLDYNYLEHKGSNAIYGQVVQINQPEIWTKAGYRFNEEHLFEFQVSSFFQDQKSYFGTLKYKARQYNFYGNLFHKFRYKVNDLKSGFSFRYNKLEETIGFTNIADTRTFAGNYLNNETIPGVFTENTSRFFNSKLTSILGIRADYLTKEGIIVTPRFLLKYDITPKISVRSSIGKGWRTVNLFSENIGMLSSSRNIVFGSTLKPEKAFNMGMNLTWKFSTITENVSGYVSSDYYYTHFTNQITPDYDSIPQTIFVTNFTGTSISNGFQFELFLKFYKRLEIKTGYNYLDVFYKKGNSRVLQPFNPRHKVLLSMSYRPISNQFHVDLNLHWFGEQVLPDTRLNPIEYQRPGISKPYSVANIQFTYNFKHFEIYSGCENIFDFRQKQPIISWQNPFGPYFDTSSVWGPTRGREVYIGMNFKLLSK